MVSIYIHWPYCSKICPYCNFSRVVYKDNLEEPWFIAIKKQIDYFYDKFPQTDNISTIFFGGGTPSLISPTIVEKIVVYIRKKFQVANDVEITLEANPNSSEVVSFSDLKLAGVNRLSLGIQSFDDDELKFLGRVHNVKEAEEAYLAAISIFSNVSCDFIYGLSGTNVEKWQKQAKLIAKLDLQHLSLYQLTIEENTPFYNQQKRGCDLVLTDDQLYEYFAINNDIFSKAGFKNYEISNFAKDGYKSKHNLNYWKYGSWYGFGPSAAGRLSYENNFYSIKNISSPKNWLANLAQKNNYGVEISKLSNKEVVYEKILCGLRLTDGVIIDDSFSSYLNFEAIAKLKLEKLLDSTKTNLRLTTKGAAILNSIALEILI